MQNIEQGLHLLCHALAQLLNRDRCGTIKQHSERRLPLPPLISDKGEKQACYYTETKASYGGL